MKNQYTAIMCNNIKLVYIYLISLITMSACQHHVHMDGSDPQNVNCEAGTMPLETHLVAMDTDEKDLTVSHTTSSDSTGSNSLSGTSAPYASVAADSLIGVNNKLSHTLYDQVTNMSLSGKNSTCQDTDNEKQDAGYNPEEHREWFDNFVTALEYEENNDAFITILDKGKKYLGRVIDWEDDAYTPMHYAAKCGDLEVVKILAEKPYSIPLDLKAGECQRTPCHFAALMGHLEVISYLIEKNKKILDQSDQYGCGPVHYAASGEYASNVNVIHELITRNKKELNHASFNVGSLNLLHLAIRADNFHMVDYLVTVCPYLLNSGTPLPLDYAQAIGNSHVVNRIKEALLKALDG